MRCIETKEYTMCSISQKRLIVTWDVLKLKIITNMFITSFRLIVTGLSQRLCKPPNWCKI